MDEVNLVRIPLLHNHETGGVCHFSVPQCKCFTGLVCRHGQEDLTLKPKTNA